jgi:Protein of unknown function (DUF3800)
MFRAYFDESGIHGESKILVMACYLAPAKEWERFVPRWQAVLDKYDISVFHANHCNGNKGIFRRFRDNQTERNQFVVELLATISDRPRIIPFAAGVEFKSYDELFKPALSPNPEHPYYIAMKTLLSMVGIYLQDMRRLPSTEKAACIFERQSEFSSRAISAFNFGLSDKDWSVSGRFDSITFGSPEECIPLQAADALAYDTYRELSRLQYHPERRVRPSYEVLTRNTCFGSPMLWDEATMKAFMKKPSAFTPRGY